MLGLTRCWRVRTPLALFTIKHFQCKQKHALTPANVRDIFASSLLPRDRLLRQSRTGGGATRVLVLDRAQHVKGVYSPLLCLPHPTVVEGGDSALGLTAEAYVEALTRKAGQPLPTTLIVISHPYGVAFAAYAADGSVHMPVHNICAPPELVELQTRHQQQLHQEQQESAPIEAPPPRDATEPSPLATPQYIGAIMAAITASFREHLAGCSTFFFITRDNTASLTLADLQQEESRIRAADPAGGPPCAIPFSDKRWIELPDSVLQSDRRVSLYTRDPKTKERIVSQAGLTVAVTHGKLELDSVPKRTGAADTAVGQLPRGDGGDASLPTSTASFS